MPAQAAIYLPQADPDLRKALPGVSRGKKSSAFAVELNGDHVRFNVLARDEVSQHLLGFRNYVSSLVVDEPARSAATARIKATRTVLGMLTTGEFSNGAIWDAIFRIANHFDGFVFVHDSFVLPDGRALFGPMAAQDEGGDADEDADGEVLTAPVPPGPQRVARRALVMSAVAWRAFIEVDEDPDSRRLQPKLRPWLEEVGIADELEPDEAALLKRPFGRMKSQEQIDASWRSEGLAVLAWALGRYELPAYDESVDSGEVVNSLGLLHPDAVKLLRQPKLRPRADIEELQASVFSVHWRLRQFRLTHKAMDFAEFARSAKFGPFSLERLRLVKGDLAIGSRPIHAARGPELDHCQSITQERHRAVNWLIGLHEVYSEVDTPT